MNLLIFRDTKKTKIKIHKLTVSGTSLSEKWYSMSEPWKFLRWSVFMILFKGTSRAFTMNIYRWQILFMIDRGQAVTSLCLYYAIPVMLARSVSYCNFHSFVFIDSNYLDFIYSGNWVDIKLTSVDLVIFYWARLYKFLHAVISSFLRSTLMLVIFLSF